MASPALLTFPAPSVGALLLAYALDRLLGEPPARLHPVVWIGTLIGSLRRIAPRKPPRPALLVGAAIAVGVPVLAVGVPVLVMDAIGSPLVRAAVETAVLSTTFAVRGLGGAALVVAHAVARGDLSHARAALAGLCSRDPTALGAPDLCAAAVESVAENASDSVVAPLVFYALFGLPGALLYRAINTLDAMLGYRGPLEHLGKASARLDDLANLIPARLTVLLLLCTAPFAAAPIGRGVRVWWRDARKTQSPNAGHPMAAMAGVLGVRLDKPGAYSLGSELRAATPEDVQRAVALLHHTSLLSLGLAALAIWLRGGALG